ncbi:hypothetical protein SUGI_0292850 [Cryptomeria japonica]|uniref:22.0 kDa class IV heat shock protein n=1 Tax=Cryptomeria japonica TaxID=3369 RepID=UPI0024089A12|nr:22.0 kDa class IV heat shock protein [Cryptomeria japonica]GLJ16948.1 hypothetical protein SUGI_0292850 [Cryptomeria japonica]
MVTVSILMVISLFLMSPATAIFPYRWRTGDLWDAILDPLKLLDQNSPSGPNGAEDVALAPTNWKETTQAHVFIVDVPGLQKEEIKIEVDENRVLTISGQRVKEEEKLGDKWHRVERGVGKFWRRFNLPGNVDIDSVKASLDNGLLTVAVAKISDGKAKTSKIVDIADSTGEL